MKHLVLTIALPAALIMMIAASAPAGTVTDIDGHTYQTVVIGTQVWMAENLKVGHYNNGDPIPYFVPDSANWTGVTVGQCCAPEADTNNVATYGLMYNWHATVDPRGIAPEGWHVSTDDDWKVLEVFLGMPIEVVDGMGNRGGYLIGARLKEVGSIHWACPNEGATDEFGFAAIPGGVLDNRPLFTEFGMSAFFWTATERTTPGYAWARDISCNLTSVGRGGYALDYAGSVRCVRDEPMGVGDDESAALPFGFDLHQNFPNPFNPSTAIEYGLPSRSTVTIEVFNVAGQRVQTLVNEVKAAGTYQVEWDGMDETGRTVSTGVYLYRFRAGDYEATKKMLLVK